MELKSKNHSNDNSSISSKSTIGSERAKVQVLRDQFYSINSSSHNQETKNQDIEASHGQNNSEAPEQEADLGPIPPAGKVTRSRWQAEQKLSPNFKKNKGNYEKYIGKHIGGKYETRPRKQVLLKWIDERCEDIKTYFVGFAALHGSNDPETTAKYESLYNTAMEKKQALGKQKNAKQEEKYKAVGEYLQATKDLVKHKKRVEISESQLWQDFLNNETVNLHKELNWLTDNNKIAGGFNNKTRKELQSEYNKTVGQALDTTENMKEASRDQWQTLRDKYKDIISTIVEMKLDRKIQEDMWNAIIKKRINLLVLCKQSLEV